jgi:succinate dehydrogenase/fumarate reductase flavoprotein subunit
MVGNEGKTRVPVYETLVQAGFDPDKDMLQVPVMHPDAYHHANFWAGMPVPLWRQWGTGGLVVDWDLRTNLDGLYAVGGAVYGGGAHSSAAASGRYAGRKAAASARTAPSSVIDPEQVKREKARIYMPLIQQGRSIGWKELNAGICRIMQDYCGQFKSDETLQVGLRLLGELAESEAQTVHAANPHELARAVECLSLIAAGEAVIRACLARRASSKLLNFTRLDYPDEDPSQWEKLLLVKQVDDQVTVDELPLDYHLRPPYAPTYQENYSIHCDG